MPQTTLGTEWAGPPSPARPTLTEEAAMTISANLKQIQELKDELAEMEKELEQVEADERDLDPAEGEEVTYDCLAPMLEEDLKDCRRENEMCIEVLAMEIKTIQEGEII